MRFCVVWCVLEYWTRARWNSITCWVCARKISWSDVCRRRCSSWDSPRAFTTPVSSSDSDTSGKIRAFVVFFFYYGFVPMMGVAGRNNCLVFASCVAPNISRRIEFLNTASSRRIEFLIRSSVHRFLLSIAFVVRWIEQDKTGFEGLVSCGSEKWSVNSD